MLLDYLLSNIQGVYLACRLGKKQESASGIISRLLDKTKRV